jgi:hypothetical protein
MYPTNKNTIQILIIVIVKSTTAAMKLQGGFINRLVLIPALMVYVPGHQIIGYPFPCLLC